MPYPDEAPWWYMHQEPADEFRSGKSKFFPLTMILVIFDSECDGEISHSFDPIVAYGNPVCILAKILDDRLCATERLFTVRYPFLGVTGI